VECDREVLKKSMTIYRGKTKNYSNNIFSGPVVGVLAGLNHHHQSNISKVERDNFLKV